MTPTATSSSPTAATTSSARSPPGTIERIAGTSIAGLGYAGPSGFPASLSSLDHPQNVAVNAAGDVYIADTYNNRVLKVTPSGQVTAVAGDGTAGYSGDGRLATFAELNEPTGVAVDAKGNLYIADSANNVIRRVDAGTGIITTVAGDYAADKGDGGLGGFSGDGGPATSAQLNVPQGVAVDGAGDLFIADTFNNAIREVTPAGVITTVVNASAKPGGESNGAAATTSKLNTPYGVAIDPPPAASTSPTPTTARSPKSRAWPSPAQRRPAPGAPSPRPAPDRPPRDEEETFMTDNAKRPSIPGMGRRTFVGSAAAVAGAAGLAGLLPENLAKAATRSPREFDLSQVKHLVFQMQENRSFDHYFGTFPGARGFKDPTAIRLPNGRPVFQQPDPANPDGYLEPWHMSTITTGAAAVPSLSHDWRDQHASWNQGAMDGWLLTHIASDGETNGSFTMGYYTEEDIPFHWALAKAFTLADNYHCSVMGPTDVNRIFWEEGGNDPQGKAGGPVLETGGKKQLTYESGPETLFKAGISYKFYQGIGWPQDTITLYFKQFQARGLVPDALFNAVTGTGTLFGDGTPGGIGDPLNPTAAIDHEMGFEEDCANGVLPDVSFIGSKSGFDEHPAAIPAAGAQFLATKLEALASNEELWNTTLFIINYDENDGFFDHVVPPTPDPNKYPEEFITLASPAGTPGGGLPNGAGFRVPAFVISPWTVGGQIFSEVSDHTSCLRLIEAVAAAGGLSGKGPVTFPNISRWRRKTFSDFTGPCAR